MAIEQFSGVGRRKTSVARVYLRPGTGVWEVNGRTLKDYLPRAPLQTHASAPLDAIEAAGRFDVKVNVNGGGLTGQAGAIRMGIARALLEFDAELRPKMREGGFLTRDSREVERKKPGRRKARRRFQFSKR